MKRNDISVKIRVRSLFLTLLLVLLFSAIVGAQNKEDSLTVDIWSDRGGQGIGVLDGGTYDVGEEIIFYLYVSTASQVKWTIRDPSGSEDVREETLEAGTHEYPDVAEEHHVGPWDMTFEAWAKKKYAFDTISFTVVGAESVSPAPTGPCSEIVGSWSWFNGGVVTVRSDGTIEHDISGNSGRWECIDPDEGTVTLRWDRGGWVDILTLSVDGNELQGTNNAGISVSGQRVEQTPRPGPPSVAILEDDFDFENQERGTLNYSDFANWDVTRGSVDLIGHDFYDFFKGHGLYLDLDGSTGEAGRLESKTRFTLESGEYRLQFDLAGSPMSGPNTVTVSLGNLYREDFTLEANEEFGTIARTIRVPTTTSAKLIFDHSGRDNEGLILDNVKLTKVSGEILKREEGALDLSRAGEAWAREWTVVSTLTDFVGGKAGFYPEAVRSGHANPNPGRTGILYLHPKSQQEPARITRRVTMTGPAPILTMGVSGNRDVDGDWVLVVRVDGKPLGEKKVIAGAQGWQDLEFNLSPFSGQTVTIEIEAWANDWHYEYAFFDYVE